jgi:hypothetical protein
MQMDWNWFYSAAAQSAAAIVGIFGAFIFTKIINNQTQFNQRRERLANLLQDARRLKDEAGNRYFAWYNRLTNEDGLNNLRKDLKKEEQLQTPEEYFLGSSFSRYQPIEPILSDIERLVEDEKARRKRSHRNDLLSHLDPLRNLNIEGNPILDHSILTRRIDRIETERNNIDKISVAVRAHASKIRDFLAESNQHPESSPFITISVMFSLALFYVGVIYPLFRLPALINIEAGLRSHTDLTIRLFILVSMAFLFTGIMLLFLFLNLKMKMRGFDIVELAQFSRESAYSEFLGYDAENQRRNKGVL